MSDIDKITNAELNGKGVRGLPDTPGLTTTEMQNKLDEVAVDVLVPKVNELVENANETNATLGETDISDIGDGTVTGALDEINSNLSNVVNKINQNKRGSSHSLTNTSETNKFICPNDGYLYVSISLGGKGYIYLCDSNGSVMCAVGTNETDRAYHDTLFVKAGMQLYASGQNEMFGASFVNLAN